MFNWNIVQLSNSENLYIRIVQKFYSATLAVMQGKIVILIRGWVNKMELISYILQFESEVFLNLYVNFESCSRIAMSIHDFTGSERSDSVHHYNTKFD